MKGMQTQYKINCRIAKPQSLASARLQFHYYSVLSLDFIKWISILRHLQSLQLLYKFQFTILSSHSISLLKMFTPNALLVTLSINIYTIFCIEINLTKGKLIYVSLLFLLEKSLL